MSKRKLNWKGVVDELEAFCNTATTHGVGYFFGSIHLLWRFAWLAITIVMVSSAAIWIKDIMKIWNENPTSILIDSQLTPIEEIQFPTITICSTFEPDKWAFVRNIVNLIDFKCHDPVSCWNTVG